MIFNLLFDYSNIFVLLYMHAQMSFEFQTVRASQILSSLGRVLDLKKSLTQPPTDTSTSVGIFFSHVWNSNPAARFFGILWHLNWNRSLMLSFFLIACISACMCFYVDGRAWTSIEAKTGFTTQSILALAGTGLILIFLFACEFVFSSNKKCFLDRYCIEQSDPDEKRKGIASIPNILARTNKLVVLLSDNYFTRLWCVYEIAIFRSANGANKSPIVFVPLRAVLIAFLMTLGDALSALLFRSNLRSRISKDDGPTFLLVSVGFSLCAACLTYTFAYMWQHSLRLYKAQIAGFSVEALQCSDARDREALVTDIAERFNGIHNFEQYVKKEVANQIAVNPEMNFLAWVCAPSIFAILGYVNVITQRMGLFCFKKLKLSEYILSDDSFCWILDRPTGVNIGIMVCDLITVILYYPIVVILSLRFLSLVRKIERASVRVILNLLGVSLTTSMYFILHYQFDNVLRADIIRAGVAIALAFAIYIIPRLNRANLSLSRKRSGMVKLE